jgi:periplasmic copper chaperone A
MLSAKIAKPASEAHSPGFPTLYNAMVHSMRRCSPGPIVLAAFVAVALGASPVVAQEPKPAVSAVTVTAPWARATPGGAKVGGAYLEITAKPGAADALVSAHSTVAGVVELHTHVHDGGVMRMRRVEEIAVPAAGKVTLKPGGLHIMLMDLKQPLKEGETIDLTLTFRRAGEVQVKVPVLKVGSPGPGGDAKGGHRGHGGHGDHGKH